MKEDGVLIKVQNWNCHHTKYEVDSQLDYVKCGICGEHLNPMWVLTQLCSTETRAKQRLSMLNDLADKAVEKNRCKCEHCKKMTRIQK